MQLKYLSRLCQTAEFIMKRQIHTVLLYSSNTSKNPHLKCTVENIICYSRSYTSRVELGLHWDKTIRQIHNQLNQELFRCKWNSAVNLKIFMEDALKRLRLPLIIIKTLIIIIQKWILTKYFLSWVSIVFVRSLLRLFHYEPENKW